MAAKLSPASHSGRGNHEFIRQFICEEASRGVVPETEWEVSTSPFEFVVQDRHGERTTGNG